MYTTKINNVVSIEWDRLVILLETGTYQYEVDPEIHNCRDWTSHLGEKTWFNSEMSEGLYNAFNLLKAVKLMLHKVE